MFNRNPIQNPIVIGCFSIFGPDHFLYPIKYQYDQEKRSAKKYIQTPYWNTYFENKLHRGKSFLLPTKINIAKLKKVFEILRVEIQKCFPQYFKKDPTLRISDCLEPFLLYIINISNLKMNQSTLTENKSISNQSAISLASHTSSHLPPPHKDTHTKQDSGNNSSESIQKILSSSIQRAKQKIIMLEGRQKDEKTQNKHQRASSKDGHNNAVASAMKVLQSRVHELEQSVENHERERTIILKELDNLSNEKKLILNNLDESNRKITVFQSHQKNSKNQIKELTKQLEEAQLLKNELESKCQSLEMSVRHLEKDKQQLSAQLVRKQQQSSLRSLPPSQKNHQRSPEKEQKERMLMEREKKVHDRERKIHEWESSLKEKQNKWTSQKAHIKDILKENEHLKQKITQFQQKLEEEQDKESQDRQSYEFYLQKIKQLESEICQLRQTTNKLEHPQNNAENQEQIQILQEKISAFQDKNEELLRLFKRSEEKAKRQEKQVKNQKEKIRQLQDLLTDMVEKIGKLPTCTKDLKYLTVKAGKIFSNNIQKVISLKTPTKSRSNSLNRSLSRSASQRKNTQLSQLNNSRTSNKAPQSGSKSKRKTELGSGTKSKSKSKRIVVSQSGLNTDERQLADLRKEYKKLVKIVNETQSEQARDRLNELAFLMQSKNENQTKTRQQNRLK